MENALAGKNTFRKILKFTFPTIVTMIFASIYNAVDSYFISNYVGKAEFGGVSFIAPLVMMLAAIGFMFGTGGSALISKTFGEGDKEKSNKIFSLILYVSILLSILIACAGFLFLRPIAQMLGAKGELLEHSITYGRFLVLALPAFILQFEFQSLFSTAGKPQLFFYITVIAGITNVILDALFIIVFKQGLQGAALATLISQCIGGFIPLLYFALPNSSSLRLCSLNFAFSPLIKVISNGFSELLSQISMSFVSILYNMQLLKYAGADGVATYGVLMSVGFMFFAIFIGYAVGVTPIIGYQYGAKNTKELKTVLSKSLILLSIFSSLMFFSIILLSYPLAKLFVGYDADLLIMVKRAFYILSFTFLFAGFSMFISAFFTALNNGLISAIISFLRTVVFQVITVLIFPLIWGVNGIWFSVVGAEVMSVLVALAFLILNKKRYGY